MTTHGDFMLLLHAHLPYVRHSEHEVFFEETWLYESIWESYLPLLEKLESLLDDGVPFRLAISISPTLLEMFDDPLLRTRALRHMERLEELAGRQEHAHRGDPELREVASFYRRRIERLRKRYTDHHRFDLTGAFRKIEETGCLELLTTAATHGYLPNLAPSKTGLSLQVGQGMDTFREKLGRPARGFWLPECGYAEGVEKALCGHGAQWTVLESHGLLNSRPRHRYGVFRPARTPAGLVVFAREEETTRAVWSREVGYPGDPRYRDFYRDIGFEIDREEREKYLHPEGLKMFSGLKFWRIEGAAGNQRIPYEPAVAAERVELHANHYLDMVRSRLGQIKGEFGFRPLIMAPYDAELFGHWWFEGVDWLGKVLRGLALDEKISAKTPSEVVAEEGDSLEELSPSFSSWGRGGFSATWVGPENDWAVVETLRSARRLEQLFLEQHKEGETAGPEKTRAMAQAIREFLLMGASDWLFMMAHRTAPHYARNRFGAHLERFAMVATMLEEEKINASELEDIYEKDGLFAAMDPYALWGRSLL